MHLLAFGLTSSLISRVQSADKDGAALATAAFARTPSAAAGPEVPTTATMQETAVCDSYLQALTVSAEKPPLAPTPSQAALVRRPVVNSITCQHSLIPAIQASDESSTKSGRKKEKKEKREKDKKKDEAKDATSLPPVPTALASLSLSLSHALLAECR